MSQVKKLIAAAKMYQQYGIVCVPTILGDKRPRGEGWQKTTETDFDAFTSDVKGMGIVTGKPSGLSVVDIDDTTMWQKILNYYKAHDEFDMCAREVTPSGSIHYYFAYDERIPQGDHVVEARDPDGNMIVFEGKANNTANPNRVAIDGRNKGGFIVCAPSLYACGRSKAKAIYNDSPLKWHVGVDDIEGQYMECPEWLLNLLTKKTQLRLDADGNITNICAPKTTITKKLSKSSSTAKKLEPQPELVKESKAEEEVKEIDPFDVVLPDEEIAKRNTLATIEEITEGLNILNPYEYGTYAEWCNLLWSVARGTDEAELDEDTVIDLLDEFSQKAAGYESRTAVAKKYNESGKRAGQQSKVTFGSFRMWVSEAKKLAKEKLKKHVVEAKAIAGPFSDETYLYEDFVTECTGQVFNSEKDMVEFVSSRVNKVLTKITIGDTSYLKKDSNEIISRIDRLGENDFTLTYKTQVIDKRRKVQPNPIPTVEAQTTLRELNKKHNVLKRYMKADYWPNHEQCPKNEFNLWRGFRAKRVEMTPERRESIEPILHLLKTAYASSIDPETKVEEYRDQDYKWLLSYFREMLVHPETPTRVCLFLYSIEGTGKNSFIDWFANRVVGDHLYHPFSGLEQAGDKHNSCLEGKTFIIVNELGSAGADCRNYLEVMKSLITDPKLHINPKFIKQFMIRSLLNWVMISNHKDSIYKSKTDRRYQCMQVSDRYKYDEAYWDNYYKATSNQDVADAFYTYLLDLDPTTLPNPRKVTMTPLAIEMIRMKQNTVHGFIEEFIEEQNLKRMTGCDKYQYRWSAPDLYAEYKEWCVTNGVKMMKPRDQFCRDIADGPDGKPLLEKVKSGSYLYIIPVIDINDEDLEEYKKLDTTSTTQTVNEKIQNHLLSMTDDEEAKVLEFITSMQKNKNVKVANVAKVVEKVEEVEEEEVVDERGDNLVD